MAADPWLSVVMPTYNGAAHLPAALASIQAQQNDDLEILAVDDGSTDHTLAILESFARVLPMRIIRRNHGGNWVANSNHGLALARGQWVCFLHQDDTWLPRRLERLRAWIAQRPEAGLVLHPSWFIQDSGRRLGVWRCPLPVRMGTLAPELVLERLLVQNFIAMPAPLFRRDVALAVSGMDESLWYTADWDFWLKLAAACRTTYLPCPLADFRIHPLSQTQLRSARTADFRRQLEIVLLRHAQPWLSGRGGKDEVLQAARFSLELNTLLAASLHRSRPSWQSVARRFCALGPGGWRRFLRDSCIGERVAARLRARLV
jgi:glycosyltransferase involved in cell wall biosynthesis